MPFQVACVQFAPRKAQVGANLDRIVDLATQAAGEGARLVVFPEASTSGYFLEGGVLECALTGADLTAQLESRLQPSADFDLVLGFYEQWSGQLYNSAAYLEIQDGSVRLIETYRKFFLPTYGVFDEERFVNSGSDLPVFATRSGTVALLICEDVWHSILPTIAAVKGAELLIVPSASPARGFSGPEPSNLIHWGKLLQMISGEHNIFCLNAMLSGFEGGKGFTGGSSVTDPFGQIVARGPVQEEHVLLASVDLELIALARSQSPLLGDLRKRWSELLRLAEL